MCLGDVLSELFKFFFLITNFSKSCIWLKADKNLCKAHYFIGIYVFASKATEQNMQIILTGEWTFTHPHNFNEGRFKTINYFILTQMNFSPEWLRR